MRVGNEPCEDWQKQPLRACSQKDVSDWAHRAKPATDMKRSGMEVGMAE
ncbi:MAG: hypothetical protein K2L82_12255 [Lachnospiraceae bacterium]|nr:hypothetical protein [Lachnospiraceae bacterium]